MLIVAVNSVLNCPSIKEIQNNISKNKNSFSAQYLLQVSRGAMKKFITYLDLSPLFLVGFFWGDVHLKSVPITN